MNIKYLFIYCIILSVIINNVLLKEIKKTRPFLKVHLICHSHSDAGWLNTFEEYFQQDVNKVLTHVVDALSADPIRKFVWSEMGFLERWWLSISDDYRDRFTKFVKNGQMEIINGGWVMNDEACPTIDDVIRQLSEGHRFIIDHFGEEYLPKSGWQIDPFGHSTVTPYLQSLMGYKHIILDRLHFKDKEALKVEKDLQFIWRNSKSDTVQAHTDMLAHVLDDFYFSPPHLSFENEGNLHFYNLQYNIEDITKYAREKASMFKSPHILIPIGGDFHFRNAEQWMDRIDQIERTMKQKFDNEETEVYAVYSNLKDFFNDTISWHTNNNVPFKYYDKDFLTYADNEAQYWTGYYTSRPHLKGEIRETSSLLRSAEIFSALNPNPPSNIESLQSNLQSASKNLSILQHHDAVTGTARKDVVIDYSARLQDANTKSIEILSNSINSQLNLGKNNIESIDFNKVQKDYLNMDSGSTVGIAFVNSLNWNKSEVVSIKISKPSPPINNGIKQSCPFIVYSDSKLKVEIPFDCSSRKERMVESAGKEEIVYFQIDFLISLPQLGSRTYFISHITGDVKKDSSHWVPLESEVPLEQGFFNQFMRINFKKSNSLIESIQFLDKKLFGGQEFLLINQKLMYYNDKGGAYVFQPDTTISDNNLAKEPDRYNNITRYYWDGNLVKEAHIYFRDSFSTDQVIESCIKIKMFNTSNLQIDRNIEFNFIVESKVHSTSVIRFSSTLKSDGIYSDNGLELLKKPIASNLYEPHKYHYPSVAVVMMKDETNNLSMVCNGDRTKGVGGLKSGEFEFALHRNLDQDDQKGLEFPNNDNLPINVKSQCYFTTYSPDNSIRKDSLVFSHPTKSFYYYITKNKESIGSGSKIFSLLSRALPNNIHILDLTRKTKTTDQFNIRIMNIQESGGSITIETAKIFNKPIEIIQQNDLANIRKFDQFLSHDTFYSSIPVVNQTILSNSHHPFQSYTDFSHYSSIDKHGTVIKLLPLEIKSFTFKFMK